jgi:hypothetical protein
VNLDAVGGLKGKCVSPPRAARPQVRAGRGVTELPRLEVPGARSPCPPLQLPTEGRKPPNRRIRVARFGSLTASHSRRVRPCRLNPFGPCLARFQARCPVCPRAVRPFGRSARSAQAGLTFGVSLDHSTPLAQGCPGRVSNTLVTDLLTGPATTMHGPLTLPRGRDGANVPAGGPGSRRPTSTWSARETSRTGTAGATSSRRPPRPCAASSSITPAGSRASG